ncbi:MAG: hypothetical protein ABI614_03755, partial [Planctomycetota bacterium]
MLFHPSKILTCLLAVGAPVYAQQSTSARVIKVGGALRKQSAEGLAIEFRGGRQANTSADDSQAVARPVAVESEQPRNFPRGAVDSATELAIIDRNRDNAIQVAERRVEFAREKMAQFAEYNRWTPPNDQPPMATRMLPHSTSYSPVSVTAPVQNFVPRSTFAHVLMAAER